MRYKKGTFINIPNKQYLLGKPPIQQGLFFWLCVHADDDGICFPSRKTLAGEINCDVRSVDKYMKILESDGLVNKTERYNKRKKKNDSNLYQLMIVNSESITPPSESNNTTPSERNDTVTVSINNYNQGTIKGDEPPATLAIEEPFNFKVYLNDVINNERNRNWARHFSALFLKRKGLIYKDKRSTEAAIKGWLWAGKILGEHTGDMLKIQTAFTKAENMEIRGEKVDWDLKTVVNQIKKI